MTREPGPALREPQNSDWETRKFRLAPSQNQEIPAAAHALDVTSGNLRVLGFASGRIDGSRDHHVFFVHPTGVPTDLRVVFQTKKGPVSAVITPEATLRRRDKLRDVPWYVAPTLAPRWEDVTELDFGERADQRVPLPPS